MRENSKVNKTEDSGRECMDVCGGSRSRSAKNGPFYDKIGGISPEDDEEREGYAWKDVLR
jgi:hypothetical protein